MKSVSQPPVRINQDEGKVYGFRAVLALFRKRPDVIIKVYLAKDRERDLRELLRWCSVNKKAFKLVETEDLERLAGSLHHEGVVVVVRESPSLTPEALLTLLPRNEMCRVVVLEEVENPHNLGAIFRSCAYFGVQGIIICAPEMKRLPAATFRTAEGGVESVGYAFSADTSRVVKLLSAQGFEIVATSPHATDYLVDQELPQRTAFLFGSEGEGLGKETFKLADRTVAIPGTGAVESLNVAQAVVATIAMDIALLTRS